MGALDTDRLDAVSNRLGEAVLDPGTWSLLLEEICRAVGTTGASLLQSDIRTPDIPMTESATEIFKSYFDNNLHVNDVRAIRGVPKLLVGVPVISDQDLFTSERDMVRDPLYSDLEHFGFRWWAAVGFQAGSALWGLTLQRTVREGPFEATEKLALAKLSQRLTETATLSKAVGRLVLSGMTNALHHVHQPALALDRLGFVIDTNAMATVIFDDEIRIRNRRLFVRDKQAKLTLDRFIDQLRTTPDTPRCPLHPSSCAARRNNPWSSVFCRWMGRRAAHSLALVPSSSSLIWVRNPAPIRVSSHRRSASRQPKLGSPR